MQFPLASPVLPSASAPASSANLGPGFDVLALALELRCWVHATPAPEWTIEHDGPHSPDDGDDLILEVARRVSPQPLALVVENSIPIGKGLGSSAAATTAAAVAAWRAAGNEPAEHEVFELVAELEAHPDNAAAAVYGGLVLCAADGPVHRLPLHPRLTALVLVPSDTINTNEARAALADSLDRPTVVRSLARAGALVAGLVLGDRDLLAAAAGDEMHEAPRSALRPDVADTISAARDAGAFHVAWSGSGPAVIALVDPSRKQDVSSALLDSTTGSEVLDLEVASRGYQ